MSRKHQIPTPAHPHKRREALPWQQPKATEEDPEALRRVQAILNSPSYRRAENDSDFLARDDVRGVRLQIDYLKPELLLEEHEIHQTIVVFGSTRICEPAAALRKVEALRASLADDPSNLELGHRLAIAERIHAKSHYYEVAREFGASRGQRQSWRSQTPYGHRNRRRAGNDGGRQPWGIRCRSQVRRAEHQLCLMSNIRTPTSRPNSVSAFIISPCASCISSCGPRRWSRSRGAMARSTNCSRF